MQKIIKGLFSENTALQVKKATSHLPQTLEYLNPNLKKLSEVEIKEIQKTGASFVLPTEMAKQISISGIDQDFVNHFTNYKIPDKPYKLFTRFLSNSCLLFEYNEIFREFMQSVARDDFHNLNLACEPYLAQHINSQLQVVRNKGFFIELETLRCKQEMTVVDWKIYKNLRINRFKNYEKSGEIAIKDYCSRFSVGKITNEDTSIFENNRPFLLSVLMRVRTPMKLSIFNQNLSLKLYGKNENEDVDYLVRFESELRALDFFALSNNPNRASKLRHSRITDLNNVLKGNPYINEEIKKRFVSL